MKDKIRKKFLEHWDEMMTDLGALMAIDSVRGEASEQFPFGPEPARALSVALAQAERLGFKTENVDNYAGTIDYGDTDEMIGVMAHLDIVPAGKGWTSDPFTLTERDGRLYGRGVDDNKGPAVAALYGMRILRELNIPLKKKIRLILGTNEEQGSDCLKYYAEHRPIPSCGFTPDGEYPLINGEKGNFWTKLVFPALPAALISMTGGDAFNIVPAECSVVLDSSLIDLETVRHAAERVENSGFVPEIVTDQDKNIRIICRGVSAHGSVPYKGVNAAVTAAKILRDIFSIPQNATGDLLAFVADAIGRETDGVALGLKMDDDVSGGLTLNLGWVKADREKSELGIDIRFPVSVSLDQMKAAYTKMADHWGAQIEIVQTAEPHYVPADDPVVEKLIGVYREVTGERDAQPFTIGGGTYAKAFGRKFVAFGPEFPGMEPTNVHNADENIRKDVFLDHCVICALAMAALAGAD